MCPGTALGFFWALGAAAERRELYRFSADLGKLALRLADQYGSSHEKWYEVYAENLAIALLTSFASRALLLFCALVSGYDGVHIRTNVARLEEALKYGQSAGDRLYSSFSSLQWIQTRLYICDHHKFVTPILVQLADGVEQSANSSWLCC